MPNLVARSLTSTLRVMNPGLSTASDPQRILTDSLPSLPVSPLLKRRASPSFDCVDDNHKRMKSDKDDYNRDDFQAAVGMDRGVKFADMLSEDLHCGCCSELVYRPVLVIPCQHFFCGR